MIGEYGAELYADLLRYYRVDLTEVVAGRGPSPALVLALVEGLPEDSATVAAMRGGREWRGWTQQTRVLADLYDAVSLNTRASGRWKRRAPRIPDYPRPKQRRGRGRRGQTVADVRRVLGIPAPPPPLPAHIPRPQPNTE